MQRSPEGAEPILLFAQTRFRGPASPSSNSSPLGIHFMRLVVPAQRGRIRLFHATSHTDEGLPVRVLFEKVSFALARRVEAIPA